MITAVTLSLALAFEPGEAGVMNRPPRDPAAPMLDRLLVWRIVFRITSYNVCYTKLLRED